jgi:hypothetical protein
MYVRVMRTCTASLDRVPDGNAQRSSAVLAAGYLSCCQAFLFLLSTVYDASRLAALGVGGISLVKEPLGFTEPLRSLQRFLRTPVASALTNAQRWVTRLGAPSFFPSIVDYVRTIIKLHACMIGEPLLAAQSRLLRRVDETADRSRGES